MLIAICGKAGAGKDTVADYLVKNHSFEKISLADPIKRLIKDVFVLDDHVVYDREEREKPLEEWNGWTVRKLLQFIGTELFREKIDDAIWVKSLWNRIRKEKKNYVVADVRFPNELEYFKENCEPKSFYCFKIIRPGYDGNVGISGHASESYDLKTDYVVVNDGDFAKLYEETENILKNIV